MKFKVGDRVKVIWLEDWQIAFKIGDVVTITREHPEGSPPHYSVDIGGGNIWWLTDEEIELYEEKKMTKYTTEPIDYTGCHPVIAEHLKRGEAILCRVRDNSNFDWSINDFMVESYSTKSDKFVYMGYFPVSYLGSSFVYAEPMPVKRKVLMSAEKAVVKLIENGWKVDTDGRINHPTEIKNYCYLSELKRKEGKDWNICKVFPDYLFEEVED